MTTMTTHQNPRYVTVAALARTLGVPESSTRKRLRGYGIAPDATHIVPNGSATARELPLFLESRMDELRNVIVAGSPIIADAH